MVIIVMNEKRVGVQEALNITAAWYRQHARKFMNSMADLPVSGDAKIDDDLRTYVRGLAEWVTGNFEWCYETERYWGRKLDDETRACHELVVEMMPQRLIAVAV